MVTCGGIPGERVTVARSVLRSAWTRKNCVLCGPEAPTHEEKRYRARIGVMLDQAKGIENPISCVHAIEQIFGAIHGAPKEIVGAVLANSTASHCGTLARISQRHPI